MKKLNLFITLMLLLLFVLPVRNVLGAEESSYLLDFSLMLSNFNYKEIRNNTTLDSESANIPGIELAYTYQPSTPKLFLRLITDLSYGNSEYNGATWAGNPLSFSHSNTFFNIEGNVGYCIGANKIIVLYIGVGHQYWYRESSYKPGDYSETYSLYYFPVGAIVNLTQGKSFTMSFEAALRYMFKGTTTAFFSDVNNGYNDVALNLGSTTGGIIKINISYLLYTDKDISLLITPWYENSSIGQSNKGVMTYNGYPQAIIYEPSSNTNKFGLNAGLRFSM